MMGAYTPEELHRRFAHHPPTTPEVGDAHSLVRACLEDATTFILNTIEGVSPDNVREKAAFLTKMEEAMFWAQTAIARPPEDR